MGNQEKTSPAISKQLLRRLPFYLNYLKSIRENNVQYISAPAIARELGLNEVQVRKDLAAVSSSAGKPKTGFAAGQLIRDIESFLGYDNVDEAILVGVGFLGKALLAYKGFGSYGLKILMGFDNDKDVIGTEVEGKQVLPASRLEDFCKRLKVHIGIITVPPEAAQEVCDKMVEGGILAIWNFAPVHLKVPDHVLVENQNMITPLVALSKHLAEKMANDDK